MALFGSIEEHLSRRPNSKPSLTYRKTRREVFTSIFWSFSFTYFFFPHTVSCTRFLLHIESKYTDGSTSGINCQPVLGALASKSLKNYSHPRTIVAQEL